MTKKRILTEAERAELASIRAEVEDIQAQLRAIDFTFVRNRTAAERAELRRWLAAGKPDRWPVA